MTMLLDNAITRAVARTAVKIAALEPSEVVAVEDSATLDMADWLALGDKSSRAYLAGLVDADTAQSLHNIHTRFREDASLAERVVFLGAMREILAGLSKL